MKKGGKINNPPLYAIYNRTTDELLFMGNSEECAKFCGYKSVGIFYTCKSKDKGKHFICNVEKD